MTFFEAQSIAARRARNAAREARRQAELTRMSERFDYAPTYQDTLDGHGNIVRSVYLGHEQVLVR